MTSAIFQAQQWSPQLTQARRCIACSGCRHAQSGLRLSVASAWSSAPPPVEAVTWSALDQDVPLGALGLTFPDESQVPRLLREVLEQIAHYREHARAYAPVIMRAHAAAQVLACLGRAPVTSPERP